MARNLDEAAFEDHVCRFLLEHGGYAEIKRGQSPPDYDAAAGLDTAELFAFMGATQGAEWTELLIRHGSQPSPPSRPPRERAKRARPSVTEPCCAANQCVSMAAVVDVVLGANGAAAAATGVLQVTLRLPG